MKSNLKGIRATMALLIGLSGFSAVYGQAVVQKDELRVVNHIYQILDKDMVKVTFDANSSVLNDSSMKALADFVKATKDESKVERYLVAAWADQETPDKGMLSKVQRELAVNRSNHIKKALETSGAAKIDTFEMTKQPNWIQKAFSTETAEIKGKGVSLTDNDKLMKNIGLRLRQSGGPRTVVVIAKFKNQVLVN